MIRPSSDALAGALFLFSLAPTVLAQTAGSLDGARPQDIGANNGALVILSSAMVSAAKIQTATMRPRLNARKVRWTPPALFGGGFLLQRSAQRGFSALDGLEALRFTPGLHEVVYLHKGGHDELEPTEGERIDAMELDIDLADSRDASAPALKLVRVGSLA
jgi:hypothetical protein